jgi:Skp family chaperone for outer membrane proteins
VESVASDDINRNCEKILDSSKSTTISEETEKETKVNKDNDKQKKLVKDIKEKLNMSNEDGICDSDDEFDSGNNKTGNTSKTTLQNKTGSESVEDNNRTKNKNMKEAN